MKTSREAENVLRVLKGLETTETFIVQGQQVKVRMVFFTFCSLSKKRKISFKCEDYCDSSVRTTWLLSWLTALLPAKSLTALHQAGITVFSLSACRRRFCSNSAQSALSAAQGHTQKHQQVSNTALPTHTHTDAQSRRDPCLIDKSPLTASTGCTDKTSALHQLLLGSCSSKCHDRSRSQVVSPKALQSFFSSLVEMIMKSRAGMLMHCAYELKNARYLRQYKISVFPYHTFSLTYSHSSSCTCVRIFQHIVCRLTMVLCLDFPLPLSFSLFPPFPPHSP